MYYILGGKRSRSLWKPLQGQIYLKDIVLALASVIFRFYCIWIMTITVNLDSIQLFSIFPVLYSCEVGFIGLGRKEKGKLTALYPPVSCQYIFCHTNAYSASYTNFLVLHFSLLSRSFGNIISLHYSVLGLTERTYSEPSNIE